jgi:hypothetical protein
MKPILILFALLITAATAAPRKVAVFIALCDNASQGIIPVPAKIGNGDDPASNLYWGCSDGLPSVLKASKAWKLVREEAPADPKILKRSIFTDNESSTQVSVEGWRGSEIRACLQAFESALVSGEHALCVFIGHNVLMDGEIPELGKKASKPVDAMVLCCKSESYFKKRLEKLGSRPVLLTTQLMYPGGFLVKDTLPLWARGGSPEKLRAAAGASYAKNQKISTKAATGVFAVLP